MCIWSNTSPHNCSFFTLGRGGWRGGGGGDNGSAGYCHRIIQVSISPRTASSFTTFSRFITNCTLRRNRPGWTHRHLCWAEGRLTFWGQSLLSPPPGSRPFATGHVKRRDFTNGHFAVRRWPGFHITHGKWATVRWSERGDHAESRGGRRVRRPCARSAPFQSWSVQSGWRKEWRGRRRKGCGKAKWDLSFERVERLCSRPRRKRWTAEAGEVESLWRNTAEKIGGLRVGRPGVTGCLRGNNSAWCVGVADKGLL